MNNKEKYIVYTLLFSAITLLSVSAYFIIKNISKSVPSQNTMTQNTNEPDDIIEDKKENSRKEKISQQEDNHENIFFVFLHKITHPKKEIKKQEDNKPQTNYTTPQPCNSNQEYLANDLDEITVHCGDIIILTLIYKPSTGYTPFSPEYDPKVFKLISVNDKDISSPKSKEPGYTGGDSILRTYKFKTLQETTGKTIDIGVYREWEPEKTKTIVQKIKVVVDNQAPKFSCNSNNEYYITNLKNVTIHCGDIVKISITYNETTGYTPFPPEYDKTIFKLLDYADATKTGNAVGDSHTTRTYRFKAIKESSEAEIKLGIYKKWEPDDSKIIKQDIKIVINNNEPIHVCNSNKEYNGDNQDNITLNCGDILILTLTYNVTTGYTPFPPQYDKNVFNLLSSKDKTSNPDDEKTGNSITVRTYQFKAIGQTNQTTIKLGIYRSWEPDNSKIIKKSINVTIK